MKRPFTFALLLLAAACGEASPTAPGLQAPAAPAMDFVSEGCSGIICGPNYIYLSTSQTQFFTWTAAPTAGTAPYTYSWRIHYDLWGSGGVGGNSSSVTFGVQNTDYHFYLEVTVRDAGNNVVHNDWHRVLVCDTPTFC